MSRGGWAEEIYPAAELFVQRSLRSDASFVTGVETVWTADAAEDFYDRFVIKEDLSGESFLDKLVRQLTGAPDPTLLLAADLVALCTIPIYDMGADTKSKRLRVVLSLLDPAPEVDPIVRTALSTGIASYGPGNAQVWKFMRYLAEFARAWIGLTSSDKEQLLADPWAWKGFLAGVPGGMGAQAAALLHLVYPEIFEPLVSVDIKSSIGKTFARVAGVEAEPDADRKLALVRSALAPVLGETFQYWDDAPQAVWRSKPSDPAWTFAEFARKFRELPTFERDEIHYKLELASRLAAARESVLDSQPEWLDRFKHAFAAPNNITSWRAHGTFLEWCASSPVESERALRALWSASSAAEAQDEVFLSAVPTTAIGTPGNRANILGYLLGAWDPDDWVNYKTTASNRALQLSGLDTPETNDAVDRIRRFTSFIDELRVRVVAIGGPPTTRLEAQGMAWYVVGDHIPEEWSEADRAALATFRAQAPRASTTSAPRAALPVELRAWYFRGAGFPDGSRFVTHWLEDDFVAVGWFEAGPMDGGASWDEVRERVQSAFPDQPPGWWKTTTLGLHYFLTAMSEGDLVVTTEGSAVLVGRVTGSPTWDTDGNPWIARRRTVEWLNRDAPASLEQLSPSLRGSLKVPLTLSKIADAQEVAALVGLATKVEIPKLSLAPVAQRVADRVYFDIQPLQEMVDLLGEKRQLVFFGPPGTGKTLVAQVLAEHLTSDGGAWQLVQFHPSYSYEDFMEGYRPTVSPEGAVSYELKHGPLRRIVENALEDPGSPYVLIVDEINRGNIPKIFGELLFLLEYRDEPIALQYSEEPFSLPPNLYLIGTMNTADRSIALVDAALRRRFYFVPFLPRESPVKDVLPRWLAANDRDDRPARLLDMLNEKIAKDEVSIGPSYLMTGDGSDASLRVIWRHAILPLLEEHYYGTKHEVDKEFGLDACLAAIAGTLGETIIQEPVAPTEVELSGDGQGEPV